MSDEPFLGFAYEEIPVTLMQEAHNEFICMHDLQVIGEKANEKLCAEALQCSDADVEAMDSDPSPPSNKEALNALSIICWQLIHQGDDLQIY